METAIHAVDHFVNKNSAYGAFSFCVVVTSLIPLAFKEQSAVLVLIEYLTTGIFIIEYLLRWFSSPALLKHGRLSYILYPFTPMAIIDLVTILPTFILINQGFKAFRVVRLVLLLRLFRFVRESRSFFVVTEVIKKEKNLLAVVFGIALAYVLMTALLVFNIEPDTFNTFFDAFYWACVSLTTVGYGDIYPISLLGRTLAMVSSLVGIAIIALPAGIITGGYIEVMKTSCNPAETKQEKLQETELN